VRRHAKAMTAVTAVFLVFGAATALALQSHVSGADLETVPMGAFNYRGLAVDQSGGDVYAVDLFDPNTFAHGFIHRFHPDGSYDEAFDTATASFSEGLNQPQDVAVDNSGGGSDGTVYVADTGNNRVLALDASGAAVVGFGAGGQINGVEDSPGDPDSVPPGGLSSPCGVAVDNSNGNLFVADRDHNSIWIFSSAGAYLGKIVDSALQAPCGLAFTSGGDLYVQNSGDGKVLRFNRTSATDYSFGSILYAPEPDQPGATDVAVETATDHVYVDKDARVSEYDAGGSLVSDFAQGDIGGSSAGIAVESDGSVLYVSAGSRIATYGPLVTLADVVSGKPTSVSDTAATVTGSVDPVGIETTECFFEWGPTTSYGNTSPCAEGDNFTATADVSAELTGLTAGTAYHYRLAVANAEGTARGQDRTFASVGPPAVGKTFVSDVSVRNATVKAELNPHGAATTYRFEYVDDAAYGSSGFASASKAPAPEGEIAGGEVAVVVSAALQDLEPATRYHYRLVAENFAGPVVGPEQTFTTYEIASTPSFSAVPGRGFLPDNRAWEMVSPPDKNGGFVRPVSIETVVSPDGNRATYDGNSSFAEARGSGAGGNTQYVAVREATGWRNKAVTRATDPKWEQGGIGTVNWFSTDVTATVFSAFDLPYVDGDMPEGIFNLYREELFTDPVEPVTVAADPGLLVSSFVEFALGAPTQLVGGDEDFQRVYFTSIQRLLPEAHPLVQNLYEWDEGELRLAGVLPDGTVPASGSTSPFSSIQFVLQPGLNSTDGSRVLFAARPNGKKAAELYVRRNGSSTAMVSESEGSVPVAEPEGVRLEFGTPDLHEVAFTTGSILNDEDPGGDGRALYMYTDSPNPEFEPNLRFITRKNDLVVEGMSDDGSRGFFYSPQDLALFHWDPSGVHQATDVSGEIDSWAERHRFTSGVRVSTDGMRIAFRSSRQVTDDGLPQSPQGATTMYVYDAAVDKLLCASCPRSGAEPSGPIWTWPEAREDGGALVDNIAQNDFLSRDGRRVFFSSPDALVSQDVNGRYDAYEYDFDSGQLHLLSSGHSTRGSWFAAASPSGDDAFFITYEALSAWDVDASADLYDARVDGGLPEPSAPPGHCEGDACQPAPTALNDLTPSSSGYVGPGNRHRPRHKHRRHRQRHHRHHHRHGAGKHPSHHTGSKGRAGK
jgi:NHL repeat